MDKILDLLPVKRIKLLIESLPGKSVDPVSAALFQGLIGLEKGENGGGKGNDSQY